jgi:protein TonB
VYQQQAQRLRNDRLGFALFVAGCLHLAVILGVGFEGLSRDYHPPQLAVTLAIRSEPAPENATHVAQSAQQGAGEQAEQDLLTSPRPGAPGALDLQQPTPPSLTRPETERRDDPVLTTNAIARDRQNREREEGAQPLPPLDGISPEIERLNRELASLQAEFDQRNQAYARMPKVKRLTSVATRSAVDAAYLHDWRTRVEAVGNQYYPEASIRYGIYGSLRLLVVVRADGSLENIEVLSSSGYALLDEAAIKIVRLAAPFAPFPRELRATTDKLEIIRTWQFRENRLSSK